jgi:hypothetical protein
MTIPGNTAVQWMHAALPTAYRFGGWRSMLEEMQLTFWLEDGNQTPNAISSSPVSARNSGCRSGNPQSGPDTAGSVSTRNR